MEGVSQREEKTESPETPAAEGVAGDVLKPFLGALITAVFPSETGLSPARVLGS